MDNNGCLHGWSGFIMRIGRVPETWCCYKCLHEGYEGFVLAANMPKKK